MKRTHWIWSTLLAVATVTAGLPAARGADADILKAVPENAWGVLIVRNLGELDQKLMGLTQQLNVPPMSVLALAKATTGLMNGVNDDGAAAFVFLGGPAVMSGQWDQAMALIVPAADYAGLTANMTPEDAGEGVSKVLFAGQESYIAPYGKYAVAAAAPTTVQAVLAAGEGAGIGSAWTEHQRTRFAEDDVTLFLNLKAVFNDPMISSMLQGIAAMSGGSFSVAELQETEALAIGLRVGKDGVRLGMYSGMKKGSASAQIIASAAPTTSSLLTGLPAENYLVAFGMKGSERIWSKYAETYGALLKNPMYAAQLGVPPEKLSEIATQLSGLVRDLRDVSFSISALPEGSDGMIGMAKVVSVSGGAAAKCAQLAEIIKTISAMAPNEEARKTMSLLKFTEDAETVGDVKVAHLTFHVDQAEDVSKEWYRQLQQVVGKEGLLFRIAAVDDNHIVATLGGGGERLAKILALAKSGGAPLGDDAGIKKSAAMLNDKRMGEAYLAADTLLATIRNIGNAVGEPDAIPFEVPKIDAPVAMVMAPVGEAGFQADIAIPLAVIAAAKDTAASFQAGGGGQPQASAATQ